MPRPGAVTAAVDDIAVFVERAQELPQEKRVALGFFPAQRRQRCDFIVAATQGIGNQLRQMGKGQVIQLQAADHASGLPDRRHCLR